VLFRSLTSLFSVVLHNLWSISIAVTKLHLCTNSRVKCPFPEPISKILSCSFKLIFVIILSILLFEFIKFLLFFIFFFFFLDFFYYYFCFFFFFFFFYLLSFFNLFFFIIFFILRFEVIKF